MERSDSIAIKDIREGMNNINVTFIILEAIASTRTKENHEIFSFKIADISASINLSIWGESGKLLRPGDIILLSRGYASLFRGCLTLSAGKLGKISRVGDFCMAFNEKINMSEPKPLKIKQPEQEPTSIITDRASRSGRTQEKVHSPSPQPQKPSSINSNKRPFEGRKSDSPKPKIPRNSFNNNNNKSNTRSSFNNLRNHSRKTMNK
jgi:hypothetical protein